jgi:hypothetical protein
MHKGSVATSEVAIAMWEEIPKNKIRISGKKKPPPLPIMVASIPTSNPTRGSHR